LLRFCWGLTVDAHDAVDVAQEAMTRAYADWETVSAGNPPGWVRSVALNLVRQRWRSERRRGAAVARMESQARAGVGHLDTVDPAAATLSTEVAAALRSLSARQREAVVLHHLADRSVAQVAEAMGTSEATVKTHLQRGRAALGVLLDDRTPERVPDAASTREHTYQGGSNV
ncbi:MAG: RNA polymerase sigma factor, partial [Microthrixaceae bacterium]